MPPRKTVLVVEDEVFIRADISDCLRDAGLDVLEAGDGATAIRILQNGHDVDLVLTDIRLGGQINGWDVAECARSLYPTIPVVYATGNVLLPRRDVESSKLIDKPYDPVALAKTCRHLAGN